VKRPPFGITADYICLPCQFESAYDGDTPYIRVASGEWEIVYKPAGGSDIRHKIPAGKFCWHIRTIDCWTPEKGMPGAAEAKARGHELLSRARGLAVMIPVKAGVKNPLSLLSFERIPAYIFLNTTTTYNERMVAEGHAVTSRPDYQKPGWRTKGKQTKRAKA